MTNCMFDFLSPILSRKGEFCPPGHFLGGGIMSRGDFVRGDYVRGGLCRGGGDFVVHPTVVWLCAPRVISLLIGSCGFQHSFFSLHL